MVQHSSFDQTQLRFSKSSISTTLTRFQRHGKEIKHMPREVGGSSKRERTYYLWLIHVWQKLTQYCKVIILPLKRKKIKIHAQGSDLFHQRPITVLSHSSRVWLFATPWTVAHQAPLSMGILQARILEWAACLPPGDLPNPGMEPGSPALQVNSLPSEPQGSPITVSCNLPMEVFDLSPLMCFLKGISSGFMFKKKKNQTLPGAQNTACLLMKRCKLAIFNKQQILTIQNYFPTTVIYRRLTNETKAAVQAWNVFLSSAALYAPRRNQPN